MRRSQFGSTIAHIGMGVTIIGVAAASTWHSERLVVLKPGDSVGLAGYEITFKGVTERQGPNYVEIAGNFDLKSGGKLIGPVVGSKRKFDTPPTTTTEAGIDPRPLGDVYVVLGNEVQPGSYAVRLYFHPFVRWIWGGALIMFIGGLVSLLDRRLRIGLPQRSRPALASAPIPAE
jgi:cytochrome c-type biogenesis protein CcmF